MHKQRVMNDSSLLLVALFATLVQYWWTTNSIAHCDSCSLNLTCGFNEYLFYVKKYSSVKHSMTARQRLRLQLPLAKT